MEFSYFGVDMMNSKRSRLVKRIREKNLNEKAHPRCNNLLNAPMT